MQVLQGSLVALVTPLNEDGSVDYDSLKKLIDWHIDEGTNGIVSVGTTGESATLNVKEHLDVIDFTIKHVGKRIPVIAGTGANATNEAIELSQEAKLKGADYVLLVTPYYNKPNQSGLIKHYEEIANKVDIPQILYNVPSRTACDLKPSSVEILSKHQNIIGIKEAVDDFQRIRELINITKISDDFSVFSGDDPTFLESMSLGAHGVISVAANVTPRSISMICRNVLNSELNEANNLNDINKNLYKLLFVESNPIPVKWMLFKMGLIKNIIRLPLIQLDETFHDEVVSELNKLRLI
ncbi:MAG: 4-hydroxy-tetrahydrodipicolinate synthase [Proteobacteria bacterium]|nr:4-hydroxy-tetrahydrodipicolinate synthase [Pseudomonadota bacterium]NCX29997.1 4-hydroxy-tetrahydrodipicolinate synthase [Pseudomonadota bacterium]